MQQMTSHGSNIFSVFATFFLMMVNLIFCLIFFDLFILFMSMHFKSQKLDIILTRIQHDLSSASTIRYRRAEVPAKVLLSMFIFNVDTLFKPKQIFVKNSKET
jgi:hypothetical protein